MMGRSPVVLLALAIAGLSPALAAQSLGARVAAGGDGRVQFRLPARPALCGDGHGMIAVGSTTWMRGDESWHGARPACISGPLRVVATIQDGEVRRLRDYIGGNDSTARDLGDVDPRAGVDWLLALAARDEPPVADDAIEAAMFADGVPSLAPRLLGLARRPSSRRAVRDAASFWLAQLASAAVAGVDDWTRAPDTDASSTDDVAARAQAVFALSQQPHGAGIDDLLRIARTHRDARVRRRAIFWLGQSGDSRALDLFQEILAKHPTR